jgi:16S rRNA G966 N2-methylase RsmD
MQGMRQIEKQVRDLLPQVLARLVADPSLRFRIDSVETIQKRTKGGDGKYPVTCVVVSTNNRPLLLGQFLYFPVGGIRGHNNDYVEGYLTGFLKAKLGLKRNHEIHLEVFPFTRGKRLDYAYRYVSLREACRLGLISWKSPLAVMMRRYDLNRVLIEGSVIAGPDLSLMRTVEELVSSNRVKSMLELFAGTGSLTKIAIMNGAEKCECVDLSTQACRENLAGLRQARILEMNAFAYRPRRSVYDLVVADLFLDFAYDAAKQLAKRYTYIAKKFMLTVGYVEDLYLKELVIQELRKWFPVVEVRENGRLVHAVCEGRCVRGMN